LILGTCRRKRPIKKDGGTEVLTHLGLTSCQARIYLALVCSGAATPKTISKESQVAREQVYREIPKLQALGLTEKIIDRPSKFKAIPIQECISFLMEKRTNRTLELQTDTEKLIKNFSSIKSETTFSEEENQFILVPKNERVLTTIRRGVETAQTSVDVVTSWKRISHSFVSFNGLYKKALSRGVKFRFVTEKPKNKKSLDYKKKITYDFHQSPLFEIRHVNTPVTSIVSLKDKKEVLIFTSASSGLDEASALWSNNPHLIEIADKYFEMMWTKSFEGRTLSTTLLQNT